MTIDRDMVRNRGPYSHQIIDLIEEVEGAANSALGDLNCRVQILEIEIRRQRVLLDAVVSQKQADRTTVNKARVEGHAAGKEEGFVQGQRRGSISGYARGYSEGWGSGHDAGKIAERRTRQTIKMPPANAWENRGMADKLPAICILLADARRWLKSPFFPKSVLFPREERAEFVRRINDILNG